MSEPIVEQIVPRIPLVKRHKWLNQPQRIRNYDREFPNSVSQEGNSIHFLHNGRIVGYWIIGNLYKRNFYKNPNGYYGAYPHKFKERVFALFPDCKQVLHLFSGTIIEATSTDRIELTFDIDPNLKPSIVGDIRKFENIPELIAAVHGSDLILADPMYERTDFEKHNQESFSKTLAIQRLGRNMRKGTFLGWLDTRMPMYHHLTWSCYAEIAVRVSTNTRMRVLTVLQKK